MSEDKRKKTSAINAEKARTTKAKKKVELEIIETPVEDNLESSDSGSDAEFDPKEAKKLDKLVKLMDEVSVRNFKH